jgi:hypothetical protein
LGRLIESLWIEKHELKFNWLGVDSSAFRNKIFLPYQCLALNYRCDSTFLTSTRSFLSQMQQKLSDLHRFTKQCARTNINFTKGQIILMSEVLAELFVRTLVSLRKIMLTVSLEASVTKTESYTTGRGKNFVVKTFIRCEAGTLRLPWLGVFRAFSSVVRQMPGLNPQSWGTARTKLPIFFCCSMYFLFFVLFKVLFVLCRSVYCLCVNVYWMWLPNCS